MSRWGSGWKGTHVPTEQGVVETRAKVRFDLCPIWLNLPDSVEPRGPIVPARVVTDRRGFLCGENSLLSVQCVALNPETTPPPPLQRARPHT